jgi:hypothetical protein
MGRKTKMIIMEMKKEGKAYIQGDRERTPEFQFY